MSDRRHLVAALATHYDATMTSAAQRFLATGRIGHILLLLLLVVAACAQTPPAPGRAHRSIVPAAPWTLAYADGAANGYRLWQDDDDGPVRFLYTPVTPEQSSTGHYSGGPPREEQLLATDPRLGELWAAVLALEADTARHTPDRNKGTGAFVLRGRDGERRFIVEQGPWLDALAALLARFGAASTGERGD